MHVDLKALKVTISPSVGIVGRHEAFESGGGGGGGRPAKYSLNLSIIMKS